MSIGQAKILGQAKIHLVNLFTILYSVCWEGKLMLLDFYLYAAAKGIGTLPLKTKQNHHQNHAFKEMISPRLLYNGGKSVACLREHRLGSGCWCHKHGLKHIYGTQRVRCSGTEPASIPELPASIKYSRGRGEGGKWMEWNGMGGGEDWGWGGSILSCLGSAPVQTRAEATRWCCGGITWAE